MSEPPERRSTRQRKPKIPFDDQIPQPPKPSRAPKATKALKAPEGPTKPSKLTRKAPIKATASDDDVIQLLCNQTKELDIQALPAVEEIENNEDVESEKEDNITDNKVKKKAGQGVLIVASPCAKWAIFGPNGTLKQAKG
jgi:hypothetical protein